MTDSLRYRRDNLLVLDLHAYEFVFDSNDNVSTLKVKIFVQWPFGDQLFGFSHQGKFLGAKLY